MNKPLSRLVALIAISSLNSAQAIEVPKSIFIAQYDTNQDWQLTKPELAKQVADEFKQLDTDGDSAISKNEYLTRYKAALEKQIAKDRKAQVLQTIIRFKSLDRDENKFIAWPEFQKSGDWSFNHFDTDLDGDIDADDKPPVYQFSEQEQSKKLSKEEIDEQRQEQVHYDRVVVHMSTDHSKGGMLAKYDTDDSGVISRAEYDNIRRKKYDAIDDDGNGRVIEHEYLLEYENRLDKRIISTRASELKKASKTFDNFDLNGNGGISAKELLQVRQEHFNQLDTDKDAKVSWTEAEPKQVKKGQTQLVMGESY